MRTQLGSNQLVLARAGVFKQGLAGVIGLGGLGEKVEGFIEAVRGRVDKAIKALIGKIKAKLKSIFGKGKKGKGKKKGKGEQDEDKPTTQEEKRHKKYAVAAKEALEEPPAEPIDFGAFRKQKRKQADKLEHKYDRKLKKPVRMTITFTESATKDAKDNAVDFEVLVAPNNQNENGSARAAKRPWSTDVLVEANSSFLSAAHSKAEESLEVGLRALAKSKKTTNEDIEKWKKIDEGEFKRAAEDRIQSGQRGINVPLLWKKPLLFKSYNADFAEHAEMALAVKPLARKLDDGDRDIPEDKQHDPKSFVRNQKGNLHANQGEFSKSRDKIAGVAFKASRASSASQVVAKELLAQLLEADVASDDLKGVVTSKTVYEFLKTIIKGETYEGISRARFKEMWKRTPDRKHIKNAFRNALEERNKHEWIPTSEIAKVVDLVDISSQQQAMRWLKLMHHLRTDTDQIVFLRNFEFKLREFTAKLGDQDRRSIAEEDSNRELRWEKELKKARNNADTAESMKKHLGKHSSHKKAFAEFPDLAAYRQPLHDLLRGLFDETKTGNPKVFVNALLGNLSKMLWFPPEGWEHPAREEAQEGESKPEWERMERLAQDQRIRVSEIALKLKRSAEDAGVTGVAVPSEFEL